MEAVRWPHDHALVHRRPDDLKPEVSSRNSAMYSALAMARSTNSCEMDTVFMARDGARITKTSS
jgi:hypothetical protein